MTFSENLLQYSKEESQIMVLEKTSGDFFISLPQLKTAGHATEHSSISFGVCYYTLQNTEAWFSGHGISDIIGDHVTHHVTSHVTSRDFMTFYLSCDCHMT